MSDLWIRGGTVVTARGAFPGDILIRNGRIAAVVHRDGPLALLEPPAGSGSGQESAAGASGAQEIAGGPVPVLDATGLYILPGLVDVHVHFRDPGLTHKEDFTSGTAAAACGGVTTVLEMPNTMPPVATAALFEEKRRHLAGRSYVDYGLYGVIDEANFEHLPALAKAGAIAFKLFLGPTTGDIRAPGWGRLMDVFSTVAELGLPLVVHAEDRDVIDYHVQKAGPDLDALDYRGFLATRPPFGELAATQTTFLLALMTGARVHIAHVTLGAAVDLIRVAREQGAPVTAETCPPYLLMTAEDCVRLGPATKILPPIRDKADQERLWEGLHDGTLEVISTDHAPHLTEEKATKSWAAAPGGMIGVETILPSLLTASSEGRLTLPQLVEWTSTRPAQIFGLGERKGDIRPGLDGDLVLVDLGAEWTLRPEDLHSKSTNSPLLGARLRGKVVHTVVGGRLVVESGRLVGAPGGRWLPGPAMDTAGGSQA